MGKVLPSITTTLFLSWILAAAEAPEVLKVEPPGWWTGHSINPVRLLIRGRNLTGARIESAGSGLRAEHARVNEDGTYLFVDLWIDSKAVPGSRILKIRSDNGRVEARFDILKPLPSAGRFQGFSPDDVIYLIMPDRFCNGDPANDDPPISKGLWDRKKSRFYHGGDLQGIINRLPYLKDLGITAIWLNPVYDNVNHLNQRETYNNEAITDYHGYGAVDFYAVDEHFGDINKFRELVDAAHSMGIKIIQDQVANHTGPYHPWTLESPTPTWFNGTEKNHRANTWQTWTLMDPHSDPAMQKATLEGWFINILPDLNQNDPEVARYLIQNTLWWIGMTGLDGIRQDMLPYVPRQFWHDWMQAIKREYPHLRVVGEAWDGDSALVSFFQGGRARFDGIDSGVDSLFDFPLFYPIRRAFAESKPVRELALMLSHDYLYCNPAMLVTFLGLHDVPRFMNESGADAAGLKLAYSYLMTTRGIPLIYYGDEIGLPGGGDPDNRRDFPGGWSDDPRNTFESRERTAREQEVFSHVRRLTHLRSQLEPLRRGTLKNLAVTDQTYAFTRQTSTGSVLVLINNGSKSARVEVPVAEAGLSEGITLRDHLGSAPDARVQNGKISIQLQPRTAAIYAR